MTWPLPLAASLALVFGISARANGELASAGYECASGPRIVGPCFEVRGRLSFWNGAPSARIWPIGTQRMLGVHRDDLPPALGEKIDAFDGRNRFDTEAWATFTVCPFTRSEPRHMQFVCIESWRGLSLRRRAP